MLGESDNLPLSLQSELYLFDAVTLRRHGALVRDYVPDCARTRLCVRDCTSIGVTVSVSEVCVIVLQSMSRRNVMVPR